MPFMIIIDSAGRTLIPPVLKFRRSGLTLQVIILLLLSVFASLLLQFVNEDSDLEISSFEEITQDTDSPPKKQHAARGSGELAGSQGTSTWSSSSTRAGAW